MGLRSSSGPIRCGGGLDVSNPGIIYQVNFAGSTPGAIAAMLGGLTLSRASGAATIRSSANTVAAGIAANTGRIYSNGTIVGLALEEARTNNVVRSTVASPTWVDTGGSVLTNIVGGGPDGNDCGRIQDNTAAAAAARFISTPHALAVPYSCSMWYKDVAGAAGTIIGANWNSVGVAPRFPRPVAAGWLYTTTLGTASGVSPSNSPALIPAAAGSIADLGTVDFALVQEESGAFATSAIVTAGAAATRSGERLFHPTAANFVRGGRLGLEVRLYPLGTSAQYSTDPTIWFYDANNNAVMNKTTRVVTVTVAGAASVFGAAMPAWVLGDYVDVWIEAGGGALSTYGAARVNGGARTVLGTNAAQGTVPAVLSLDLLCNGTAAQFSSIIAYMRAYSPGIRPAWVV